jgi:hypothetical protein
MTVAVIPDRLALLVDPGPRADDEPDSVLVQLVDHDVAQLIPAGIST